MIVRISPREYALISPSSGRILGRHRSVASAKRQERAINIAKARAAGHNIPFEKIRQTRTRSTR